MSDVNNIEINLYKYFNQDKKVAGGILKGCVYTSEERPLVLIVPGGAYSFLCYRENTPFAKRFYNLGYNAFYLDYSCGDNVEYPTALNEVIMAITFIRENYKGKLAIMGFSAGGHLVGQSVNGKNDLSFLGKSKSNFILPNASVYCYPVVSTKNKLIHESSFRNLLKDRYDELKDKVSLENLINKKSPPAFIFHCADDSVVPVGNSIVLAKSYIKSGVPIELHIFPKGNHGVALPTTECFSIEEMKLFGVNEKLVVWFDLCVEWLKKEVFYEKEGILI